MPHCPVAAGFLQFPKSKALRRLRIVIGSILCAVMLLSPISASAQTGKAPDVPLKLLQADRTSLQRWSDLKGKAVVLEFWATWCGPCIEKFPRLTELAAKFADKPVQFIFLTDESLKTTQAFLKRRPISAGWVAYDAKETLAAFDVTGRPTTILIDKSGHTTGEVFTTELNEQVLEDLIAGKPVGRKASLPGGPAQTLASAWITRSSDTTIQMRLGNDLKGRGVNLETLLEFAYNIRYPRMEFAKGVDRQTRYDFEVKVSSNHPGQSSALWRGLVEASLPMRIKKATKERSVWVLLKISSGAAGLRPSEEESAGTYSFDTKEGEFLAERGNFMRLTWNLENALEEPVVDESGLSGKWRMEMRWKPGDPANLRRALEEQMGLRLERAQRSLETLQIEPL